MWRLGILYNILVPLFTSSAGSVTVPEWASPMDGSLVESEMGTYVGGFIYAIDHPLDTWTVFSSNVFFSMASCLCFSLSRSPQRPRYTTHLHEAKPPPAPPPPCNALSPEKNTTHSTKTFTKFTKNSPTHHPLSAAIDHLTRRLR